MEKRSLSDVLSGRGISQVAMRALTIFTAIACVSMVAASTAVVTAKRYESRNKPHVIASGQQGGGGATAASPGGGTTDNSVAAGAPAATDNGGRAAAGGQQTAAGPAAAAGPTGQAAPQQRAQPGGASQPAPAQAGGCTDAKPDQGIYCDPIASGGTTVLS